MDMQNFKRYCPICGQQLITVRQTNWTSKPYIFHCPQCIKNYYIQFCLVEYKHEPREITLPTASNINK